MKWLGETLSTRRKTCPAATLSTNNPTWINPGSNLSLRGESRATNHLNVGTAKRLLSYQGKQFRYVTVFVKERGGNSTSTCRVYRATVVFLISPDKILRLCIETCSCCTYVQCAGDVMKSLTVRIRSFSGIIFIPNAMKLTNPS
jgi:hypothetical protein